MSQRACICVFAKPPVPGQVKTRLIPLLGSTGAAELAAAFLQDTWASLNALRNAKIVLASTCDGQMACLPNSVEVWPQGEGDLGARIENTLRRALRDSPQGIAIGADSPGLPTKFLEQAQEALNQADAVIGPSYDGGFYLLGLRTCPEGLLSGIRWSSATTCEETTTKLRAAGLTLEVLDPWFDVDTVQDLEKLNSMISTSEIQAPNTKRFLEDHEDIPSTAPPFKCSVIIPALNELHYLPHAVAALQKQTWIHEVVVADGGSTDGTRDWLALQNFAKVVDAPAGKGNQLNAGVRAASGEIFLFLHADCELPSNACKRIASHLESSNIVGGCFQVCFRDNSSGSLKMVAAGINFRSRMAQSGTGDQGIFVRRAVFEKVGGFPDWPLFEDVELVKRIKKAGRFAVLPSKILISPRRHLAKGVFRTVLLVYALRIGYWCGVSPFKLKKWFSDSRPAVELVRAPERSC